MGDKVRVVVKTISVSRKALAAGLDADDLVGTVQEVWGMENEGEDGSGLTVLFEGAGDADDFEYIFSEFELEKVRRGPWTLTAQGSPPATPPPAASPGPPASRWSRPRPVRRLPRRRPRAAARVPQVPWTSGG